VRRMQTAKDTLVADVVVRRIDDAYGCPGSMGLSFNAGPSNTTATKIREMFPRLRLVMRAARRVSGRRRAVPR
jgi:hypothetical protein